MCLSLFTVLPKSADCIHMAVGSQIDLQRCNRDKARLTLPEIRTLLPIRNIADGTYPINRLTAGILHRDNALLMMPPPQPRCFDTLYRIRRYGGNIDVPKDRRFRRIFQQPLQYHPSRLFRRLLRSLRQPFPNKAYRLPCSHHY